MLTTVLAMIVLISALVFIHELGHYLVARYFGIGVEVFSIGFGKALISFKKGNTVYQLAAIPLGGYVKLVGSTKEEEVPEVFVGTEMYKKAPWKRLLVLAAGPVFNLVLAALIFAGFSYRGIMITEPYLGHTISGGVAYQAGLKPGDKVISIDGESIDSWESLRYRISTSPGKQVKLAYEREGKTSEVSITPEKYQMEGLGGEPVELGKIGIYNGYLNTILSVPNKNSLAFKSGLRTGDRLKVIEYLKQGKLQKFDVQHWHMLLHVQKQLQQDKPQEVTLVLKDGTTERKVILKDPFTSLTQVETDKLWESFGLQLSTLVLSLDENQEIAAQLKNNDLLVSFNGKRLKDLFELNKILAKYDHKEAKVLVNRQGVEKQLAVQLKGREVQAMEGKRILYNFDASYPMAELAPLPQKKKYSANIFAAGWNGVKATYTMSVVMVDSLWRLVTGSLPLSVIGGPIMIAKVAGDSVKAGLERFFEVMALISINLAVINFLPIPVFDGGRMVLVTFEWVRGVL